MRRRAKSSRPPSVEQLTVGFGALLDALPDAPNAAARSSASIIETLGRVWQREVDATVKRWIAEVQPQQLASAERQIELYMGIGDPVSLASLQLPVLGVELLDGRMRVMAAAGALAVVHEAAAQGVELDAPPPLAAIGLGTWARAAAQRLASTFAAGIAGRVLQLWRPGASAADVTAGVREYVGELTDRGPRDVIGGALTQAQNLGRLQVYGAPRSAEVDITLVADETLDSNTCAPCRKIDGTVLPNVEAAALAYGGAGYLFCQGGPRCRGTVRGVWERVDPQRAAFLALHSGLADIRVGP